MGYIIGALRVRDWRGLVLLELAKTTTMRRKRFFLNFEEARKTPPTLTNFVANPQPPRAPMGCICL